MTANSDGFLPAASAGLFRPRITSFAGIGVPHAAAGLRLDASLPAQAHDSSPGYPAAQLAIETVLRGEGFPDSISYKLTWRRDALGKPFVEWSGEVAAWAGANGRENRHLHVSNTHDGGAHIILAAYSPELAGVGIDAVWLPRLRYRGKDAAYLHRFAKQFMSPEELSAFHAGGDYTFAPLPDIGTATSSLDSGQSPRPSSLNSIGNRNAQGAPEIENDADEPLRLRAAAHFSLMEAASKACGTGLKIGAGMGRETSLPKQSLGALRVAPEVQLLFGPEAVRRLGELGATRYEACVLADTEFLVSAVALYR